MKNILEEPIRYTSPDLLHEAVLLYFGEVRFGPACYSLALDGISYNHRLFGNACLWSSNSRYFAIQEWKGFDGISLSETNLLLIRVPSKSYCIVSSSKAGFILPKTFQGNKIIFEIRHARWNENKEYEFDFLQIKNWELFNPEAD